jgi:hypothetical protein
MNSTSQLQLVNSLTYADLAALNLGLSRFPGEKAATFLARCYQATTRRRDHSYEGTQDELCLQLGLAQSEGISIASTDPTLAIASSIGLVTVLTLGVTHQIPTVTMAVDNYWEWRLLSDVVRDLNSIPGVTALLLAEDGPALQLARQSNIHTVVGEPIISNDQILEHAGILEASAAFNNAPGDYVLYGETGELILHATPALGLAISYQYLVLPFNLVCTQVGLFGLTEPALATVGVGSNNVLAYQLREAIQVVMTADPSYWAE